MPTESSEQLLATRYAQLMRWAIVLTRADHAKAEEIVQEFCLYITLTKPDLTHVANLDGYLYTCLRHIYTSNLAKASRDAQRTVSLEEYDSFAMALSSGTPWDALQRQNDLRRACAYAVWRKESSKTASYFILHFFHGYARQEIAAVARVTMPTVYNKLKTARSEVGAYLFNSGKLRVVDGQEPPPPNLPWHVVPVGELFAELRQTILTSRLAACLPEEELSALYEAQAPTPIPCELLAHIVSCERCLAVVDRTGPRPTLKDREPLDVLGYSPSHPAGTPTPDAGSSFERTMAAVNNKWKRVHDHRPSRLSIALNGEIIATHDVRSERNRLSARIDGSVRAHFVEVFSEQGVRLALLAVDSAPPEAAAMQSLRTDLSDARWSELNIRFDGLGLESEVFYYDAVLALNLEVEQEAQQFVTSVAQPSRVSVLFEAARRRLHALTMPSMAWALALLLAAALGYWFHARRAMPLQATAVLNHAVQLESSALRGQTEHQVVRFEEHSTAGGVQVGGTIDQWKDGDGTRYIRRLFDDKHQLTTVEWQTRGAGSASKRVLRPIDSSLWQFWDQELSLQAFAKIADTQPTMRNTSTGYEITKTGPAERFPELVSATLVFNSRHEAVEENLQVRTPHGLRQLRFIRESYDLRPARLVPDKTFVPALQEGLGRRKGQTLLSPAVTQLTDLRQAQLMVDVLYALRSMDADIGVPIEVSPIPNGPVRVEGVVASDTLRQRIQARLGSLADTNGLQLEIATVRHAPAHTPGSLPAKPLEAYEVSQTGFAADAPIRQWLRANGVAGEPLDPAVQQFSSKALAHARRALQHAHALDRLGSLANGDALHSITRQGQHEWTTMVQDHASGVENELRALQQQLTQVWPQPSKGPGPQGTVTAIEDQVQFARAAKQLLADVSKLNQQTGELFTANALPGDQADQAPLLKSIMDATVLDDSARLTDFATRLSEAAESKRAAKTHE